jgi:hypothetical protein
MKLNMEKMVIRSLVPYENNSRKHPPDQINRLVASIKELGFNVPILIDDDNVVIAGHARLMAAKIAGLTEVPVVRLSHLDENQRKAFLIMDNRISEMGSWDLNVLVEEMKEIIDNVDPYIMGFDDDDLSDLGIFQKTGNTGSGEGYFGSGGGSEKGSGGIKGSKKSCYMCPSCGHKWDKE